jgi:hypothetical protein
MRIARSVRQHFGRLDRRDDAQMRRFLGLGHSAASKRCDCAAMPPAAIKLSMARGLIHSTSDAIGLRAIGQWAELLDASPIRPCALS